MLSGTVKVAAGAGGAVAVRPTFFTKGDYAVRVTVREGNTAIAVRAAQVLVASAFVPVGVIAAGTEIVSATPDGKTVVTTNGDGVGLVDITDPTKPGPLRAVPVTDGVTSVDVTPNGRWALVSSTSGVLGVVDLASATVARRIPIPQGADAVKVSPDGRYAAVAVEAEGAGQGGVLAVDLVGEPDAWTTRVVPFDENDPAFETGSDLQPENIDIDERNYAALSFQENNAVAVVDLASGATVSLFNLGTSTRLYDSGQDGNVFSEDVQRTASRHPDGIAWTPDHHILTPNEEGGSRSWSVFTTDGVLVFDSGAELERQFSYHGMFRTTDPEFEQVTAATFGTGPEAETFALVATERWGALAVNRMEDAEHPRLSQIVGTNFYNDDPRPEGVYAITGRDLVLVANEDENTVAIMRRTPTVRETDRPIATSHIAGWKEIVGWAASGPSSLVGVTATDQLLRLSITPTEVLVDESLPIAGRPDAAISDASVDAVAVDPVKGDVWVALRQDSFSGDPVEHVLARLDRGGRVVETFAPHLGDIVALTADPAGGRLWAVIQQQDGRQLLVSYDIKGRKVRSWPARVSDVVELIAYSNGDLGVVSRADDAATLVDRVRVSNVPEGQPALVARAANLATEFGFMGTDREVGEAAAVLPGGDLIVEAPVPQGGFIPLVRIPRFDRSGGSAPAGSVVLGATVAQAGTTVPLTIGSARPAGYQVQARIAGGEFVALSDGGQIPAGESTVDVRVPAVDGKYDVRVVLMSGTGSTATLKAAAKLVVDTPAGTATVTAPTATAPAKTYPGGAFPVRLTTERAGVATVQARPSSPGAKWVTLKVAGGGIVPTPGGGELSVTAPAGDGTYDLRVTFRSGGDAASTVDVPGGLVVATPPAPTITASPSAAQPFTTWAGGLVRVTVTTDIEASVTATLVPAQGEPLPLPGLAGSTFTGSRTVQVDAPLVDGKYDLVVEARNAAGATTRVVETGALVVATPAPEVAAVTALPVRNSAQGVIRPSFRFNQTGTWVLDTRPAGSGDGAWTRHQSWATPRTISDNQLEQSAFMQAPTADGTYDIRIGFVNEVGTAVQQVFPGAIVVETPNPALTVVAPTAEQPLRTTAGGRQSVQVETDQVATIKLEIRPAGSDAAWTPAGSATVDGSDGGGVQFVGLTAPFVASSTYDLQVTVTNVVGGSTSKVVPGGLVIDNPQPVVSMEEPSSVQPLYRRPGTSVQTFITTSGTYDLKFEMAPTGTGEWTTVFSGQVSGSRYAPATVPQTPGAYDLRATVTNADGETATSLQPKALWVGKGPGSPIVINELKMGGPEYVELRNITDAPVDASGWYLTACRQEETALATVPAGTILAPGQRWLVATGSYPTADPAYPAPNQRVGRLFANSGSELYRPDRTRADAAGASAGQGCWEGAPSRPHPPASRGAAARPAPTPTTTPTISPWARPRPVAEPSRSKAGAWPSGQAPAPFRPADCRGEPRLPVTDAILRLLADATPAEMSWTVAA
ncbi:hypothetical protein ACFQ1L_40240 [Phytohabitans flavus]|uniref:hypothetical protein n=1 Tax=Phytohabitans flavus TaxID=1076124 RepID=UPI00363A76EC